MTSDRPTGAARHIDGTTRTGTANTESARPDDEEAMSPAQWLEDVEVAVAETLLDDTDADPTDELRHHD